MKSYIYKYILYIYIYGGTNKRVLWCRLYFYEIVLYSIYLLWSYVS
jgi:hypothetical protein